LCQADDFAENASDGRYTVIGVKRVPIDSVEELVEEGCSFGLAVLAGVVPLALQGGLELDGRLEVAARLARSRHATVELDGAGAKALPSIRA
jgi:hypothetical protein